MAESLIPPSIADGRSLAVEALLVRLDTLPVEAVITDLYEPARAAETALPWLAHQFGILDEIWMVAESMPARRALLAAALSLQARRGTPWSIKNALAAIGFPGMTLQERTNTWAHFKVTQPLGGQALTAARLTLLLAVLDAWKPARCVLDSVELRLAFESSTPGQGPRYDGAYLHDGAINYEGLVTDTIAYVKVGEGAPTVQINDITITAPTPTRKVITFAVGTEVANGLTLNSYSLHSAAGTVIAAASTVDVAKTSAVSLAAEWTLNLI